MQLDKPDYIRLIEGADSIIDVLDDFVDFNLLNYASLGLIVLCDFKEAEIYFQDKDGLFVCSIGWARANRKGLYNIYMEQSRLHQHTKSYYDKLTRLSTENS